MASAIPENRAPFSLTEVLEATGGVLLARGPELACGVSTDTRGALDGRVFVALRGERFDGHAFLADALEAGAALVIAEDHPATRALATAAAGRASLIVVKDSLAALGELGAWHRRRWTGTVVAIGGSAGKTTTRSVCSALLTALEGTRVHSTQGNLNNRVGVPVTLLGLEETHRILVVELGTNAPGEVAELARIARADVGVLTLIDVEHTEGLGDLDGVEREEGALLTALAADGVAVGNVDDARVRRQLAVCPAARSLGYGHGADAALRVISRRLRSLEQTELELSSEGRSLRVVSPLAGRAGALAVAAGVLVCEALAPGRLTGAAASAALVGVGEPGRATLRQLPGGRLVLDDSYNSNPGSVAVGLETASEYARHTGGRLWLVLGEMRELGALAPEAHRRMGELAARAGAARLWAVGGHARLAAEEAARAGLESVFVDDAGEVAADLRPRLGAGDVVLVKASRGVRAERVVRALEELPA
jgi:UDP-N-acetylmuramoyl-tripeptide--D-alanyl-D-alanine ligase